jgi:hypothetical protein
MHVMTAAEVREFETKNAWATGICMDESGDLYYKTPELTASPCAIKHRLECPTPK